MTIFAAASLTNVFPQIAPKQHYSFGGSNALAAQVEILVTEPTRVVAIVTRDAVEELGLEPGSPATAIVKSTSVMVES